jgi:hypothetical protein
MFNIQNMRFLNFKVLFFIIFFCCECLLFINCSKNNDIAESTEPTLKIPQPELFPGLVKEEWYFFNPDQTYHHYEIFQYHYDSKGIRDSGTFWQAEWNNFLNLSYEYDDQGRLIKEHWKNPYMASILWDINYVYNASSTKILGGHGEGYYTWDFAITYDSKTRRASTTFTAPDVEWMAPKFTIYHQYNTENICVMSTGTEQRGMSIVIVYTYADGTSGETKAGSLLKNITPQDRELISKQKKEIFDKG